MSAKFCCSMYATDAEGCVRECQALLDEPTIDTAVRTGDIYGLLIEHFAHVKNYKQVYRSIILYPVFTYNALAGTIDLAYIESRQNWLLYLH